MEKINKYQVSFIKGLFLIMGYFFIASINGIVISFILRGIGIQIEVNTYSSLVLFISGLVIVIYIKTKLKLSFGSEIKLHLRDILIYVLVSFLIRYITTEIVSLYEIILSIEPVSFNFNAISIIYLIILAPVMEELLFRGIILNGMLRRYNKRTAIVLSTILFAAYHLNLSQILTSMIVGIVIGIIFITTESIIHCIFFHIWLNVFTILYDKNILATEKSIIEIHNLPNTIRLVAVVFASALSFILLKKVIRMTSSLREEFINTET